MKEFNLKIKGGEKIGLVGPSGCGKSTIINLLMRFYEMQKGSLIIDGKDIQEYDVGWLRRYVGFVMQEPLLFDTTIRENIVYGVVDERTPEQLAKLTEEQKKEEQEEMDQRVWRACENANALQFIETNFEDLDKAEQVDKLREMLRGVLKQMGPDAYEQLTPVHLQIYDLDALKVIYDAVKHKDEKFEGLISQNPQFFVDFCLHDIADHNVKGMRWDDFVNLIEWKYDIHCFVQEGNYNNSVTETTMMKTREMPFMFDVEFLKDFFGQSMFSQGYEKQQFKDHLSANHHAHLNRVKEAMTQRKKNRLNEFNRAWDNQKVTLHEGFKKMCGLKGSKLSGGQKQRIAIARALIKNPKILILDEATSALDENSQEIVQQALDRAMEGRTSIVIAHRLSTIRNCDTLFVINGGKVVESGTYENLFADQNSQFHKLAAGMEM